MPLAPLPLEDAQRRQRDRHPLVGGDVRVVLPLGALPAARARLQRDEGRPRLPAVEHPHGGVLARPLGAHRDALRPALAARRRPRAARRSASRSSPARRSTASFSPTCMPGMLLLGLGAGIAFNPLLLAAMSDVDESESGLASGIVNTSFMMGGALGLAVLASLAAAHDRRRGRRRSRALLVGATSSRSASARPARWRRRRSARGSCRCAHRAARRRGPAAAAGGREAVALSASRRRRAVVGVRDVQRDRTFSRLNVVRPPGFRGRPFAAVQSENARAKRADFSSHRICAGRRRHQRRQARSARAGIGPRRPGPIHSSQEMLMASRTVPLAVACRMRACRLERRACSSPAAAATTTASRSPRRPRRKTLSVTVYPATPPAAARPPRRRTCSPAASARPASARPRAGLRRPAQPDGGRAAPQRHLQQLPRPDRLHRRRRLRHALRAERRHQRRRHRQRGPDPRPRIPRPPSTTAAARST